MQGRDKTEAQAKLSAIVQNPPGATITVAEVIDRFLAHRIGGSDLGR